MVISAGVWSVAKHLLLSTLHNNRAYPSGQFATVGTLCELLEIGRIGAIISENFKGNFRMALTVDECVAHLKSDVVDAYCQAAE